MGVFVAFFLFIGLGFDYFYINFTPVPEPEYSMNDYGYYEVEMKRQAIPYGTLLTLILSFGMVINSMINGPRMVLRSTMARRAVSTDIKEKQFLNVVAEMSTAAGIPMPQAYLMPDIDLNAFATGFSPQDSHVAITEGLLKELNREELQAVIGHEMSHIKNYDIRLMTITAALMGAVGLVSDFAGRAMRFRGSSGSSSGRSSGSGGRRGGLGPLMLVIFVVWILFVILAPLISRLLAMAISRKREYLADASSAEITRNPLALASALEKIRAAVSPTYAVNNGIAHMCITDPRGSLIEEKMGLAADVFATHPPMEKRILALKMMAYQNSR